MEYMNVVRMQIKEGKLDEWRAESEKSFPTLNELNGLKGLYYIETGDHAVCVVGRWDSQEALVNARPKMVESLDKIRHLLIGEDTDPVSGPVVMHHDRS